MDGNRRIWYKCMATMIFILFFLGTVIYEKAFAVAVDKPAIFNVGVSISPDSFDPSKGEQCIITGSIRKLESSEWLWGEILPGWDIVDYLWFMDITELQPPYRTVRTYSG